MTVSLGDGVSIGGGSGGGGGLTLLETKVISSPVADFVFPNLDPLKHYRCIAMELVVANSASSALLMHMTNAAGNNINSYNYGVVGGGGNNNAVGQNWGQYAGPEIKVTGNLNGTKIGLLDFEIMWLGGLMYYQGRAMLNPVGGTQMSFSFTAISSADVPVGIRVMPTGQNFTSGTIKLFSLL